MSHFAQIDENNIVIRVIVVEQDVIDSGLFGDKTKWIQASYNTRGGVHYSSTPDFQPDDGIPLRKNYPGPGYLYDPILDAFIPPKPVESWILNNDTCLWEPPKPYPDPTYEITYIWDESIQDWRKI
ncbi:MAG: hypothetical protein ACO294_09345 [Methylococcales bacterium]